MGPCFEAFCALACLLWQQESLPALGDLFMSLGPCVGVFQGGTYNLSAFGLILVFVSSCGDFLFRPRFKLRGFDLGAFADVF